MQKMQVELDLSRDTGVDLVEEQGGNIFEKIPDVAKESLTVTAKTTNTEQQSQSEAQNDVRVQCFGLVII